MLTFDGTSRNTGFGLAVVDQVNDQFAEATSISLAPDTLNTTFTVSSTINVPNTNLGLQVRVPVTVGITYNPISTAAAVAAGGVVLVTPAVLAFSTMFILTQGGTIAAGAH
jgi:hypothetical protein